MNALRRLLGNKQIIDLPPDQCLFCQIAHGKHSGRENILYEDENLVVFPDIRPAGRVHLQVVPKRHVLNADALRPGAADDIELVASMLRVGESVLQGLRCDADGTAGAEMKFGYHVEPFHSVNHLHMHAFLLPHTPWWAAWKYVKGIPWWLPADQLLERLKAPGPAANSAVDAA